MSAIKSPPMKKAMELDRDHRTKCSENPHGFCKCWPLKKAKKTRTHRRKVSQLLHSASTAADVDPGSIPRPRVKKRGVMSVRDDLKKRKRARKSS